MRNLTLAFALAPLLGGCIYYENNSGWDDDCGEECDWWDDDGDGIVDDDERPGTGDDTDDPGDETPAFSLSIDPSSITQGETDVASLTAQGDFDVASIAAVTVLGPVAVLEALPRDASLLLVLEADADAELGTFHVLLDLHDGTTVFVEDALTVTAAASDGSDADCAD